MITKSEIAVFWFRRDLRLNDNAALFHALKSGLPVVPLFIFDTEILEKLEDKNDNRVAFIYQSVLALKKELNEIGSDLIVEFGRPTEIFKKIISRYSVKNIFANDDYEPAAIARDEYVKNIAHANGIAFQSYKDQCIFAKNDVLKDDGTPYTVFTPYSKKWRTKFLQQGLTFFPSEQNLSGFYQTNSIEPIISLEEIGFQKTNFKFPSPKADETIIKNYLSQRDFPGINGTSHLGIHLRFGTISIRELVKKILTISDTFLNELIWREFYKMILFHFPHVAEKPFKKDYEKILWLNDENEFEKWCEGKTGYPIVDAGMRELNETGFMHNRVRMITAGFLTKHLLIDWRWGEAWFAKKLLDFDLSANNGGWQWAAGCGTDAAPYFRVFNPTLQAQKFDKKNLYINKWIPEISTLEYPFPIIEHEFARKRCLSFYKKSLNK
ncbi:MAG: deoxyribodipyrimidine photo-lyase [Bacteroidota bacterium]